MHYRMHPSKKMYYYTSDLHFGYADIIKNEKRPFKTVEEMNESLIKNFNEVLSKDDILFILGDVAWHGYNPCTELKKIHGKKVLIKGNHDEALLKHKSFRECFIDIRSTELFRDGNKKIFLSHYPMAEWDGYYKGIYHFYGHVHNSDMGAGYLMKLYPTAVNVGVDCNNFYPKTAEQLIDERLCNYRENCPSLPQEFMDKAIFIKDMDDRGGKKVDFQKLIL